MAKLTDPDSLVRGTEIIFDTTNKTIQLLPSGNLNDTSPGQTSGVTLQAVYSKCKELWKTESDLNTLRFPFEAITEAKMDLVNGWNWKDQQSKDLVRDGGWSLLSASTVLEQYMCVISLGTFVTASDQAYYQQVAGFNQTTLNMDKTGVVNEPVKIYSGSTDLRGYFKIFVREQGKLYGQSNLLRDQNLVTLDYNVFRLPLANAVDIKVTNADSAIDNGTPYTTMSIDYITGSGYTSWAGSTPYDKGAVVLSASTRWFRSKGPHTSSAAWNGAMWDVYPGEAQIGSNYYAFNRIVNGNSGSLEQIYEFCQRELRKSTNINDNVNGDGYGTVNGNVAVPLCSFLGDTLQSAAGVLIRNFDVNDTNRIELFDVTVNGGGLDTERVPVTTTKRTYPFVAAGTLVFNSVLTTDPNARYWMYFNSVPSGSFNTTNAVIVKNNSGVDITGSISQANIAFDFDYDNNTQGGRTAAQDAVVQVVALGLASASYVVSQFTITRNVGLSFPVNASQERNYSNN